MSKSTKQETTEPKTISDQLREIIKASGRTGYEMAKESGVDAGRISRFLRGERSLQLDAVDKLAPVLGLQLIRITTNG